MLDIDDRVARRVAAGRCRAVKMHGHARERAGVIDRVGAGAAVDAVRLGEADEVVVTAPAPQHGGGGGAALQYVVVVLRSLDPLLAALDEPPSEPAWAHRRLVDA